VIPSKIVGKTNGENWIGLIDGFYSIVLTLLVIELPVIILKMIEKIILVGNSQKELWESIITLGVLLLGYFAVFVIMYDIWSYHKTLLFDAKRLRVFAITTGFILFLSSLTPPFYYLVNHYALEEVLGEFKHHPSLILATIAVLGIISIIYLFLAALAKLEKRQPGQTPEKREELEYMLESSSTKALITVIIATISSLPSTYLPPPIGITALAITTYFPINFFKKRQRR
jgi:uncharacterized membrane protein